LSVDKGACNWSEEHDGDTVQPGSHSYDWATHSVPYNAWLKVGVPLSV